MDLVRYWKLSTTARGSKTLLASIRSAIVPPALTRVHVVFDSGGEAQSFYGSVEHVDYIANLPEGGTTAEVHLWPET